MNPTSVFFERLVSEKILTKEDSNRLIDKYKSDISSVWDYILHGNFCKKEVLGKLWGDSIGVSYVDLNKTLFQSQIVSKLPEQFARRNRVIPIYKMGDVVTVVAATPTDQEMLKKAETAIGSSINAVFSFPADIDDAIEIQYQTRDSINEFLDRIVDNELFKDTSKITYEELQKLSGDQSIIDLCRGLLLLGVKDRASDIHIEPAEDSVRVRYRIDGVLQERIMLEKALLPPLSSCLKVMAGLDITEKRRPQDGRINLHLSKKSIDFRLSTIPTIYGEKIVLRILGQIQTDEIPDLNVLELSKSNYTKIKRVIEIPNGVFFVTGPTGSGKTTTLFAVLNHLNTPEINIMTVEDPVEYRLSGINQIQVNPVINLDFASALRSFLRQDPDVILIGEIRDLETAKVAAQAALTGHLVLATMHTNNALQAVTRLVEIGVEPFLVAPSIIGVMAQRLTRRICIYCKERYQLSEKEIEQYFICDKATDVYFYKGKGCPECNNTGYLGRLAIQEVFIMSEEIRSLVAKGASILEIEKTAKKSGFKTMRYDGLKKVLRGLITIDELERVATVEEELH